MTRYVAIDADTWNAFVAEAHRPANVPAAKGSCANMLRELEGLSIELDDLDAPAKLVAITAICDDVTAKIPTVDPAVPWDALGEIRKVLRPTTRW